MAFKVKVNRRRTTNVGHKSLPSDYGSGELKMGYVVENVGNVVF